MSFHRARYFEITILASVLILAGIAITTSIGFERAQGCKDQADIFIPAVEKCGKPVLPVANTTSKSVPEGTFLGTIRIPSIDKKVNIFQGTTEDVLSRGVGHFVHSVMPGVKDNSVLAGHRDTVFSNLGKVKVGAFILITTQNGTFIYKVHRLRIVEANDRTVIVPTPEATLTLSTCYPFSFIGHAPKRYIVSATLVPNEAVSSAA
jgi:LPXTG-site transpeptidase (sortase) family protein